MFNKKNRLVVAGRFRYCSPETTPLTRVLRPDFASGSLHPNFQPHCEARANMTQKLSADYSQDGTFQNKLQIG
jgi:hypothetical protein